MALRSVLVTGGAGFLGSAICRTLVEKHPKCDVVALDSRPQPPSDGVHLPLNISFVQADITALEDICEGIREIKSQVVIHSAAAVGSLALRYGRKEHDKIWNVNVIGTKNVLEASKEAGVAAFVYTSSVAAVMDDLNASFPNVDERWPTCHSSLSYGESKVLSSRSTPSALLVGQHETC